MSEDVRWTNGELLPYLGILRVIPLRLRTSVSASSRHKHNTSMAITHQQIDCSTADHIIGTVCFVQASAKCFWNKSLKLCTVYNKYTSRKPREFKQSCICTGTWIYHMCWLPNQDVELKFLLDFFVSFRYIFVNWKLIASQAKNNAFRTEIRNGNLAWFQGTSTTQLALLLFQ